MGPCFGNPAFFKYHDLIGMQDGRQPVSNQYGYLFTSGGDGANGMGNRFFGN